MTVEAAVRMWSRHDATFTSERGQRRKAVIKEGYSVVCGVNDTLAAVSNAPNLPRLDDLYPGTQQIRVGTVTPKQVSPIYWTVDVQYEGPYGPGGSNDSPLNDPAIKSWGKVDSDEPTDQDFNGKPIVTVNAEPIEGITRTLSDVTCTIKRNFAAINLASLYQYFHSVNSDEFLGFAPGVVHMTQFSADQKFAESIGGYYEVTAGFQMRWPYNTTPAKAWYKRVRHEGYRVKVDGEIVNAIDARLTEMNKPILLKADGTEETDSDQAHWLEFQVFQPLPYSSLGIV